METWQEKILKILEDKGEPLQRKCIYKTLRAQGKITNNTLGVVLNKAVSKEFIAQVKYPGIPSFYAHPDWIDIKTGLFKEDFDYIFKKFKKNVIKTESV